MTFANARSETSLREAFIAGTCQLHALAKKERANSV